MAVRSRSTHIALRRLLLAGAAAMIGTAAFAEPAKLVHFDIAGQDLGAALNQAAQQSHEEIVFDAALVRGRRAGPLKGDFTSQQALDRLLAGSGLAAHRDASGAEVVTKAGPLEPAAGADPNQVSELVVTAEKRSQDAQHVPLSVSALKSVEMLRFGQTHLSEYAASIPGLSLTSVTGNPGSLSVTLRGVTTGSSASATVATLVDDVPVTSSTSFAFGSLTGPDLFPYDIDQIEVLKGPQGTLYGANSLGGLLNYKLRTPSLSDSSLEVGGDLLGVKNGDRTGWGLHAVGSVALVPDQLAVGFSAAHQTTPGYIDNVVTGERGINRGTQDGYRGVVYAKPTDRLSLKLSALYDRSDFDGFAAIYANPVTLEPTYGYLKTAIHEPQMFRNTLALYSANVSYDLDWATLTSITAYSQAHNLQQVDDSIIFLPILGADAAGHDDFKINRFTQEIRLASPEANRLRWLLGAFYTEEKSHIFVELDLLDPVTHQEVPFLNPLIRLDSPSRYRELAAFGSATYRLTDQWEVTAGVRYSANKQSVDQSESGLLVGASNVSSDEISDDVVTWSVSTQYRFTPDAMVYGRIATGYQPGGPNFVLPGVPRSFSPSTVTNYEAGIKSQWFDRRLLLNAALFRIDWNDIQVQQTTPTQLLFIVNAAKAYSQGAEATATLVPVRGLKLGVNAAYTDAALAADAPALGASKGDALPNAPKWSGAASAEYSWPLWGDYSGRIGLLWQFIGARESGTGVNPAGVVHLPAYSIGSLSAGIRNDRWSLDLYVKNLADERAYPSATVAVEPVILQPRTVGMSLNCQF